MPKKLYFMLPDVAHCKQLIIELKNIGLAEHDIHVVARDDIPLEGLHQASVLQKTELAHGLELGAGVGSVAGMLGGLLVVVFPPAGVILGGGAVVLATTLAGASFCTIVSALVARDIPNQELVAFQSHITSGQILLILDIPTKRVNEVAQVIKNTHSDAKIEVSNPAL
ncbi:hypothetical protein [Candidatus Parabeggiatoa sp. HSG14]|uniref:hypothetical protein n=1 Tax=Candidatus Parabeggiatoa sp. HSG14 TaxID=3055593 RepID=UPI0025A8DB06|nr:hypothetical protein [Thiotrichales bacterium HSG14]